MTSAPLPEIPGYAVEGHLGRGGMAEVFRARPLQGQHAGQVVALKRLLPALSGDAAYVALFRQEAELTRRLNHPAMVTVFDAGVAGGIPFLAMEYVDGRNLKQILVRCAERGILLPVDFAAYVAHVIAAGAGPRARGLGRGRAAPGDRPQRRLPLQRLHLAAGGDQAGRLRRGPAPARQPAGGGLPVPERGGGPGGAGRLRQGPLPGTGAAARRPAHPGQRPLRPGRRSSSSCSPTSAPSPGAT